MMNLIFGAFASSVIRAGSDLIPPRSDRSSRFQINRTETVGKSPRSLTVTQWTSGTESRSFGVCGLNSSVLPAFVQAGRQPNAEFLSYFPTARTKPGVPPRALVRWQPIQTKPQQCYLLATEDLQRKETRTTRPQFRECSVGWKRAPFPYVSATPALPLNISKAAQAPTPISCTLLLHSLTSEHRIWIYGRSLPPALASLHLVDCEMKVGPTWTGVPG